jgi:hypothetical protein
MPGGVDSGSFKDGKNFCVGGCGSIRISIGLVEATEGVHGVDGVVDDDALRGVGSGSFRRSICVGGCGSFRFPVGQEEAEATEGVHGVDDDDAYVGVDSGSFRMEDSPVATAEGVACRKIDGTMSAAGGGESVCVGGCGSFRISVGPEEATEGVHGVVDDDAQREVGSGSFRMEDCTVATAEGVGGEVGEFLLIFNIIEC